MRNHSLTPRIIRRETPPPMAGRDGYRKAREHLRREFANRCAYCMIHEQQMGGDEAFAIDHFRPRAKGGRTNAYANLYWACIGCNRFKGDAWPAPFERRRGLRFADPCQEHDYGVHFVENEQAELEPRTPCGEYHVRMLRLNRPHRVARRHERNEILIHLAEALRLLDLLEAEPSTKQERVLLHHIRREVERLRSALEVAILYIADLSARDSKG